MSAIDDVYGRNGVLPAEKKATRKTPAKPGVEPKADEPLWKSLKVGDQIQIIAPSSDREPILHWVTRTPGIYSVSNIDTAAKHGLPILVRNKTGNSGWVYPEQIVRVVMSEAVAKYEPKATSPGSLLRPATITSPTWSRVKVGDTIRVSKGLDHEAGDYVVTRIDDDSGNYPIAVHYPPQNDKTWWIHKDVVEEIMNPKVSTRAVRGDFLIHVDVPSIMSNRANGEHKPVTVTRRLIEPSVAHLARELAWDGPTRFVHHEFMKIEGTDIQNWVETDVPVTCWLDGGFVDVMNPRPGSEVARPTPMTKQILGGFVIHIAAPVLIRNRKEGRNDPVIAVRKAFTNWASDVVFARKVEWSGPSRMVHRPSTPIPGTEGRGVAFIETDADLILTLDNAEPMVLRMPSRALAA